MVPETTGNVTPPVFVRTPAGVNTTVPATLLTATFPKFISMVFEMAIGVMIVAEAVAVAETCPKVVERNPKIEFWVSYFVFSEFKSYVKKALHFAALFLHKNNNRLVIIYGNCHISSICIYTCWLG